MSAIKAITLFPSLGDKAARSPMESVPLDDDDGDGENYDGPSEAELDAGGGGSSSRLICLLGHTRLEPRASSLELSTCDFGLAFHVQLNIIFWFSEFGVC